jgi:hypothetical protein
MVPNASNIDLVKYGVIMQVFRRVMMMAATVAAVFFGLPGAAFAGPADLHALYDTASTAPAAACSGFITWTC